MTKEQSLRAAFDAVTAESADGIMAVWNPAGTYDNPMLAVASAGFAAVRERMVELLANLKSKDQTIQLDTIATGTDGRVYARWHIEPPDGRRGIHVAECDEQNRLQHVTIYLHHRT